MLGFKALVSNFSCCLVDYFLFRLPLAVAKVFVNFDRGPSISRAFDSLYYAC